MVGPRAGLAGITPQMPFNQACEAVLDHLEATIPLGLWMVSFYDAERDRQVYVHLHDNAYGLEPGDSHSWSGESFCQYAVTGDAPQIAPDAMAVPLYAAAGAVRTHDIGAYVGIPIQGGSGRLYGTICGLDPEAQPASMTEHEHELQSLAGVLGEILARERLQAEADARDVARTWRSLHDQLTGLPTRTFFAERLGHKLGLRHVDFRPLAVMILDVDDFRGVNESLGPALADRLLVAVAERLRLVLPASDTVARIAADEFAILVERDDLTEYRPAAAVLAERLVAALGEPYDLAGTAARVSVSVGVAPVEPADRSFSAGALLARADVALHTAKRTGRGRVSVHRSAMRLAETHDLQLREPLRHAIADHQIGAAYQPIRHLATGRLTGVECLARWQHGRAHISPEVFVPLALRSGQMGSLTDLVLDLGCGQIAGWPSSGGREPRVAVHVSAPQLSDLTFPDRVSAALERHGLDHTRLTLEITEDALLSDLDSARRVCLRLVEAGVGLSLEDFGAGHSSLEHLQSITLESVKISPGFTRAVDSSPVARRFVAGLVTLGRDLGLDVVVEGVERASQAETLAGLGATHGQGYLYGPAVPGAQVDLSLVLGPDPSPA